MPPSDSSSWRASSTLAQFQEIGGDLFLRGLVSSHSGNLSLRQEGHILITRHGSRLGHLTDSDLVRVDLEGELPPVPAPSMELSRHRALYRATSARAVLHAHPPHAVALSFLGEEIVPQDLEGEYLLGRVPVMAPESEEGLGEALRGCPIAMLRGHGSFAIGQTLEEALQWTTALEDSSLVLLWLRLQGKG
ncbi:MAG: class II aldolase/adducin family protein [Chloroflexi bacterium]|nr:class II aldolase/adducin family protein [Chloroflexota bacterium]